MRPGGLSGMRLTCPKCGAQYEVDEAVIPEEGRDVQCSNCNHIWFQDSPALAARDPLAAFAMPRAAAGRASAPSASKPEGESEADAPRSGTADPEMAAGTAPEPQRRSLDDDVLSILREEAEREQRAREEEATVETFSEQADLGLASPPRPRRPDPEPDPARATAPPEPTRSPPARRDLLPDVEEITSTLSASSDRGAHSIPPALEPEGSRRRAFLGGFLLAVLVAAGALAAYVYAPVLAGLDPALEPQVAAYVGAVDAARDWIAGVVPPDLLDRALGR